MSYRLRLEKSLFQANTQTRDGRTAHSSSGVQSEAIANRADVETCQFKCITLTIRPENLFGKQTTKTLLCFASRAIS